MASITFYLDYAPYLTKIRPKAFIVYCFYDKLKNDEGLVQLTYKEVMDQIGISSSCMSDAVEILIELGLIQKVEDASERFKKVTYKVIDPPALIPERRKELFDKCGFSVETKIRAKYDGKNVPPEYLQLLDIDKMKKALEELESIKFNVSKCLADYFKVDARTLAVLLETEFRDRVNETKREARNQVTKSETPPIKKEIVKETIVIEEKEESEVEVKTAKKTKEKIGKRTTAEYYQLLIDEGHLDRKTKKEMPISEWKAAQVLRYFCICYKQRYGVDYSFTGNPFSSKEIRDMASVLSALSDPVEVKKYFDWAFNVKDKDLKGGISSTGIIAHGRMINEFNKNKTKTITTNSGLSVDFVNWVKEKEPSFFDISECKSIDDLKIAQEAIRTGNENKSVICVVGEAIRRGILNG